MIFEIVVEVEPEFVIVRARDVEVLIARLPKLRDVGLAERELCCAEIAVPLSVIATPELALLTKLIDPLAVPAEVGAKATV